MRLDPPLARTLPIVPAVVSVDVATFQTAETSDPKVSSERPLTDHTLSGIVEAREVEAVRTVASVCELMVVTALLMLVLTPEIELLNEVEAFKTLVLAVVMLVLAVAKVAPNEVEAFVILVLAMFTFVPTVAKVAPRLVEAKSV